jgi:hypothetical protein
VGVCGEGLGEVGEEAARAASPRLMPSRALASASIRCAVLRRGSFLASRRNSGALATSILIASPGAPLPPPAQETLRNHERRRSESPIESATKRGGIRESSMLVCQEAG